MGKHGQNTQRKMFSRKKLYTHTHARVRVRTHNKTKYNSESHWEEDPGVDRNVPNGTNTNSSGSSPLSAGGRPRNIKFLHSKDNEQQSPQPKEVEDIFTLLLQTGANIQDLQRTIKTKYQGNKTDSQQMHQ